MATAKNIVAAGAIRTGTPAGGTAATWKLGSYKLATVLWDSGHYVEVEVGGTLRKLAIVTVA